MSSHSLPPQAIMAVGFELLMLVADGMCVLAGLGESPNNVDVGSPYPPSHLIQRRLIRFDFKVSVVAHPDVLIPTSAPHPPHPTPAPKRLHQIRVSQA